MKKCPKCKKINDNFYNIKSRKDGKSIYCINCLSEMAQKKYADSYIKKKCKKCNKIFIGKTNQSYCSKECRGSKKKKGIDGYKKCLVCHKEFPFRNSLIARSFKDIKHINAKYCSRDCSNKATTRRNREVPQSLEQRKNAAIRASLRFKGRKNTEEQRYKKSINNKGSRSHFWKGGICNKNKIIRRTLEMRLWREAVFKRDNYTCQKCKERGGKLEAHHIKRFSEYPDIRFNVENGQTLCKECHKLTDNYQNKK